MSFFTEILTKTLRLGVEGMYSGKFSTLAKGCFFSLISVLSVLATSYLATVQEQLKSIPRIETSIVELNTNIGILTERNLGQQRIQEMHTELLHGMERRLQRLEAKVKQEIGK